MQQVLLIGIIAQGIYQQLFSIQPLDVTWYTPNYTLIAGVRILRAYLHRFRPGRSVRKPTPQYTKNHILLKYKLGMSSGV